MYLVVGDRKQVLRIGMTEKEIMIRKLIRYAPHADIYESNNVIKGKDKDVESIHIIYSWKKREKSEENDE